MSVRRDRETRQGSWYDAIGSRASPRRLQGHMGRNSLDAEPVVLYTPVPHHTTEGVIGKQIEAQEILVGNRVFDFRSH
ncbi:hypothetical protein LINPERHAP2_LOCUS35063 [Linum perenne]